MKVLMYVICIMVYSMMTTAINMNGVLLGAIPTVLFFVLCMSPAWAYGKYHDKKAKNTTKEDDVPITPSEVKQEEIKTEQLNVTHIKKKKTSAVKIIISLLLVIVVVLGIALAVYYFVLPQFQETIEEPKKFELSSNMPYSDPYGLTNINNIMGKDIRDVLSTYNGYTTDDYSIIPKENTAAYVFHDIVPMPKSFGSNILEDVKLFIFTKNNIILGIEYQGRYEDNDVVERSRFGMYIDDIKDEIVDVRDVDPLYVFVDETGVDREITKDEWNKIEYGVKKGTKSIYFFSDIGAYIEIQNLYEERKETFVIGHLLSE